MMDGMTTLHRIEAPVPLRASTPTEEDRRLVSSDLSDCEEIYMGELGLYMLETQKRKRTVEHYFEQTMLVS